MAILRAFASFSLALLLVASPLCCLASVVMYSGDSLQAGAAMHYAAYTFIMQRDCNLVLYDSGRPIWASNTGGLARNCFCTLQRDGNLVVYTTSNRPLWASNTNRGKANYVLILQKDRNVDVIYGGALWATNTNIVNGVSEGMFIESKATIFGSVPANITAAEAEPARNIAMVVNK